MNGRLPSFFKYKAAKDLVRLGKDNDGGYLVSKSDINKADFLIGLGIGFDWSFESDFIKHNNVSLEAYDATLNFKFFLKKTLGALVKKPFSFYGTRKLISYKRFFSQDRKHIKKLVGLSSNNKTHCTLESILNKLDYQSIFLKIDVEGSEYRFLDTIVEYQNRITGLVIELHDCDIHLETIQKFIKKFKLNLVHIHANNFAPIRLDDELPLVLELTFSRNAELENSVTLPNKLDMPNKKTRQDIQLTIDS